MRGRRAPDQKLEDGRQHDFIRSLLPDMMPAIDSEAISHDILRCDCLPFPDRIKALFNHVLLAPNHAQRRPDEPSPPANRAAAQPNLG